MLPESVLDTLAGGLIGIFSGLAIWYVSDWVDIRRRRGHLVDAIESAAVACMAPLVSSSMTGGGEYFNPVTQFLPAFWQDLGLLGTGTQAMVINYFSMLAEAHSKEVPLGKDRAALLEGERQKLTGLLEQERKGQRQKLYSEMGLKREHASIKSRRDLVIGVVAGAALGQGYSLTTQGGFLLTRLSQASEWVQLSVLFSMGLLFFLVGLGIVVQVVRD